MHWIQRARRALDFDNDALAQHRERICAQVSGAGACAMLPFVFMHLLQRGWTMAAVNAVLCSFLGGTALTMRSGRKPPVPFWLLICVLVMSVVVSVLKQGVPGVLWSYPALFTCYFVLQRQVATLLGGVLIAGVAVSSALVLDHGLVGRVVGSLAFVMLMINIVLNVIGQLQQALLVQAITDPLTGAYNRRHLQVQLVQLLVPASAEPPAQALLVIDIDHFKRINDVHGHDVGDAVLRKVVATVAARKRRSDLLFRVGGEEFVLLLPDSSVDDARRIAEELRQRLAQSDLLPGEPVTVSIGISTLHAGQSAEAWIKSADTALYEAKRAGRNRVALAELSPQAR